MRTMMKSKHPKPLGRYFAMSGDYVLAGVFYTKEELQIIHDVYTPRYGTIWVVMA